MQIIEGTITALAEEGRATLQVPEIVIGEQASFKTYPDDWFIRLSQELPSRQGFLFLTKKGFEANKEKLKEAFEKAGGDWSYFEKVVEVDFATRRKEASKKIAQLRKKLVELESYYRSL